MSEFDAGGAWRLAGSGQRTVDGTQQAHHLARMSDSGSNKARGALLSFVMPDFLA
jgi:hypothetical protein